MVLRVADCFEEIAIAPDATAVFRWAGSLTFPIG
jgi:hypothetical protein